MMTESEIRNELAGIAEELDFLAREDIVPDGTDWDYSNDHSDMVTDLKAKQWALLWALGQIERKPGVPGRCFKPGAAADMAQAHGYPEQENQP